MSDDESKSWVIEDEDEFFWWVDGVVPIFDRLKCIPTSHRPKFIVTIELKEEED